MFTASYGASSKAQSAGGDHTPRHLQTMYDGGGTTLQSRNLDAEGECVSDP